MREKVSCSACCGIFNLRLTEGERKAWVQKNTEVFLATDISKAENIVAYRKSRESETLPLRARDDIYTCPFVGFVDRQSQRTGCLLHPQGSPHSQIGLWEHPQNFSFYGEGICLSYDCLAKERRAHSAAFFRWAESSSVFAYGRLASDHTLHRALAGINCTGMNLSAFFDALASLYAQHGVVTTSFEDIEKQVPESIEELCHFLAGRIDTSKAGEIVADLLRAASPTL